MDKEVINDAVKDTMERVMKIGEAHGFARIILDISAKFDIVLKEIAQDDQVFDLTERNNVAVMELLNKIKTKEG